jgi:AraC family transcriptional activator of tynA and feaB
LSGLDVEKIMRRGVTALLWRAALDAFLGQLPSIAGKMNSISEVTVGNHALDLIAISLAKTDRPRISSTKSLVLLRIRSVIEMRLMDPSLGAQAVAKAVGVSVRYANAVLADHNTSIMRLVLARRLERCRNALEDPNQAHRTVSEIAYAWGFSDMTHFGRRFKKAYGFCPANTKLLQGWLDAEANLGPAGSLASDHRQIRATSVTVTDTP